MRNQHGGDMLPLGLKVKSRVDRQRLARALGKARVRLRPDGRIVVVHGAKGGCGASTLAANLAALLSAHGGPVALCDLALRSADQDLLWNLDPSLRLTDVLGPEGHDLADALTHHPSGVRVLAGPVGPAEAEEIRPESISPFLAALCERHPSVVVDTSATFDEVALAALEAASIILVPLMPELRALRATQQALGLWERLGVPGDRIRIVAWDRKGDVDAATIARVLGRPVDFRLPWAPEATQDAINAGEPLAYAQPRGTFALGFEPLVSALVPRPTSAASAPVPAGPIARIVSRIGRRIDEASPMCDARLADGSRVNAIIPPLAIDGSVLTIRKFRRDPLMIKDLLDYGSISGTMAKFLEAGVVAKLNVPNAERLITIEDAAELQLQQDHVIRLETRPGNIEGSGRIDQSELLHNSLRMRPDRIILGDHTRQHAKGRPRETRDDGPDGGHGLAAARHSRAGGGGLGPHRSDRAQHGWPAARCQHHRGGRDGRRHDHAPGNLRLPQNRPGRGRPRDRPVSGHRYSSEMHRASRSGRHAATSRALRGMSAYPLVSPGMTLMPLIVAAGRR